MALEVTDEMRGALLTAVCDRAFGEPILSAGCQVIASLTE